MATHSSILAWKIPQTEETEGLQSWGHKESDNRAHSTGRSGGIFLVKGKSIRQFSTRGKRDNSAGK